MMRYLTLVLLMVLSCPGLFAETPLWRKALDIFEQNNRWRPGTVVTVSHELDNLGNVEKVETTTSKYRPDGKGESELYFFETVRDGEAVPDRRNRRGNRDDDSNPLGISPFNPEYRDSVTATAAGTYAVVAGIRCRVFEVVMEHDGNRYRGRGYLHSVSGAPLKLELTMDPLPRFLDYFIMEIMYDYHEDGVWYPVEMIMEGEGTILFIKKRFHAETSMYDYFEIERQSE